MNDSHTRRSVLALGAATGLAGLAGCTGYLGPRETDESTETVSLDGATELSAATPNGDLRVVASDDRSDAIEVVVTKRVRGDRGLFGDVALGVASGGGRLELSVEYDTRAARRVAVDLDVRVPPDLAVTRVSAGNGDAKVENTAGDTLVETANGDATATGGSGVLHLQSGNGDVEARDCAGVSVARTGNGDVAVTVRDVADPLDGVSGNGDVQVGIPADTDADVLLRTANGEITRESLAFTDTRTSGDRFEGVLGSGGPSIALSSGNGDVRLYAL